MANAMDADVSVDGGTIIVAIVVPSVIVIALLSLIIAAFVWPRGGGGHDEFAGIKEGRMKQRLEEINTTIKTQKFHDWLAEQEEHKKKTLSASDSLCAICLEGFAGDAQIRGLGCLHVFHTQCLDGWFGRFNEYCPLCHGTIIPGRGASKKRRRERSDAVAVAFIV